MHTISSQDSRNKIMAHYYQILQSNVDKKVEDPAMRFKSSPVVIWL